MNCTFYPNTLSKSDIDVPILSLLKAIKNGKYKDHAETYRNETDQEKRRLFKVQKVPAFTASGTFSTKKADSLKEHSGFIAIDFDGVDDLDTAKAQLYADHYTYSGFASISGKGLCIIVKIDDKKHIDAFKSLEHYYWKNFGYQVDQSCKNVNRLRFVSYDPDLFINEKSKKFQTYLDKPKGRPTRMKEYVNSDSDLEHVLNQIHAQRIDLTQDYQTWVEIGMSIFSKYGSSGEDYFQQVSQYHPDYNHEKTRRKYASFKNGSGITISTFYHYAKQAGLDIITSTSKTIAYVAKNAKKMRSRPEDAAKTLKDLDGIPEEQSLPIINQIFAAETKNLSTETDEDIVFQVEEFIRRECSLRFNEVTIKYETKGDPLVDRDVNSIYLNAKKIIPTVSKDLIISCIDSDRTPIYNPIKEFFHKNTHRKSTSAISELAKTLETKTGANVNFAEFFIRKWMIGSVAMWFKHHSPLMLVLAGETQNTGKTHWFRYILPDELQPLYAEAELTGDKDENLLMCSKILIMNDEMSNKTKRDITVLKKLCSTQWFNIRKPYGKLSEDFRRIATLAGTSNSLDLLSDPTGNRRILPIEVLSIDHIRYNNIDKTDLWLEAYHAYKSGESYALNSNDIKMLNEHTHDFEEASIEADLITKYYKVPIFPDTYRAVLVTCTDIKVRLEMLTQQKLSLKKLGMEMKRLGYVSKLKRISGAVQRVYEVILLETPPVFAV